jgi:hypothetical protein
MILAATHRKTGNEKQLADGIEEEGRGKEHDNNDTLSYIRYSLIFRHKIQRVRIKIIHLGKFHNHRALVGWRAENLKKCSLFIS